MVSVQKPLLEASAWLIFFELKKGGKCQTIYALTLCQFVFLQNGHGFSYYFCKETLECHCPAFAVCTKISKLWEKGVLK